VAGTEPSCRFPSTESEFSGFRPYLAYAFSMAAVPFLTNLSLWTAGMLKVSPRPFKVGAARTLPIVEESSKAMLTEVTILKKVRLVNG
jgi:hypothetical protein